MMPKYSMVIRLYKPNDSTKDLHQILVRVRMKSHEVDLYIHHSTTIDKWDSIKQRVIPNTKVMGVRAIEINTAITDTLHFIESYFDDCLLRQTEPSLQELKTKYMHKISQSDDCTQENFYDIYSTYIEEAKEQRKWSQSTYETEKRTCAKLREVLPHITFDSLTTASLNIFTNALNKEMANGRLKDYVKKLKAFGRWAKIHKYPVCEDLEYYDMSRFYITQKSVHFLEEEEVLNLWQLDLSMNPRLEQVRDFFLFQCYTSLRVSDLMGLKKTSVKYDGKDYSITLFTQKNRTMIKDYLLPDVARDIYLKYAKHDYPNGVLFPVPSNPQYNRYLKELGRIANIQGEWIDYICRGNSREEKRIPRTELTTHIARRTFISIALNRGVSEDIVALATSHSDVKEMKPYLSITKQGKEKLQEAFNSVGAIQ